MTEQGNFRRQLEYLVYRELNAAPLENKNATWPQNTKAFRESVTKHHAPIAIQYSVSLRHVAKRLIALNVWRIENHHLEQVFLEWQIDEVTHYVRLDSMLGFSTCLVKNHRLVSSVAIDCSPVRPVKPHCTSTAAHVQNFWHCLRRTTHRVLPSAYNI